MHTPSDFSWSITQNIYVDDIKPTSHATSELTYINLKDTGHKAWESHFASFQSICMSGQRFDPPPLEAPRLAAHQTHSDVYSLH